MKNNNFIYRCSAGVMIGFINGLLGSGGGLLAVPVLKKLGLSQKEAHANAVAVILPVSLVSACLYLLKGYVQISDAFVFIPAGIIGAVVGTTVLKKIQSVLIGRIFGGLMVYAGIRLLLK